MGRKSIHVKSAIVKAHGKADSIKRMAFLLKVTEATVHNYMKKYKLASFEVTANDFSFDVARAYTYDTTTRDLVAKFGYSVGGVRYHLEKFVLFPLKYRLTDKWSPPKKIQHIKVINALIARDTDDPRELVGLPGLSNELIDDYWKHATGKVLEDYDE